MDEIRHRVFRAFPFARRLERLLHAHHQRRRRYPRGVPFIHIVSARLAVSAFA